MLLFPVLTFETILAGGAIVDAVTTDGADLAGGVIVVVATIDGAVFAGGVIVVATTDGAVFTGGVIVVVTTFCFASFSAVNRAASFSFASFSTFKRDSSFNRTISFSFASIAAFNLASSLSLASFVDFKRATSFSALIRASSFTLATFNRSISFASSLLAFSSFSIFFSRATIFSSRYGRAVPFVDLTSILVGDVSDRYLVVEASPISTKSLFPLITLTAMPKATAIPPTVPTPTVPFNSSDRCCDFKSSNCNSRRSLSISSRDGRRLEFGPVLLVSKNFLAAFTAPKSPF